MTTSFSPSETHQVFSSFRGEELRYNFVSHLTEAFKTHGIKFFIDEHEQKGKDLTHLFVRKIKQSRIAIALFSTRYPESKWCMDELEMMKKRADKKKLRVIPIFYKVKVEDVKNQTGEFGKHFDTLAKAYPGRIKKWKWKNALKCISNRTGMSLRENSYEADFIEDVVKEVQRVIEAIRLEEEGNHFLKYLRRITGKIICC